MVVGDAIIDRYLFGKIERQNPEAPVPIVKITGQKKADGGSWNVVRQLTNLGVNSFERLHFDHCCFTPDPVKTRIYAAGRQVVRFDIEKIENSPPKVHDRILADLATHKPDALIVSDYAKGMVCSDWLIRVASIFPDLPIFIDGHPDNYRLYPRNTYLKINQRELQTISGEPDVLAGIDVIKKDHRAVIVTCGDQGTIYLDSGRPVCRAPMITRKVYDVTGAGDAWIGSFVPAFIVSKQMARSVDFANIVAGISVERIGSYCPSWSEIKKGHADPEVKGGEEDEEDYDLDVDDHVVDSRADNGAEPAGHPGNIV